MKDGKEGEEKRGEGRRMDGLSWHFPSMQTPF
jgi:hypothetical protein